MKHYFDIKAATKHAVKEYPKESCGFIVESLHGDVYVPLENIHEDPENDFRVSEEDYLRYADRLKCVIHSHNNFPHCSKKDQEQQIEMAVPWGIVNLFKGNYNSHWFWGDSLEVQDYLERPFHYGAYDCYSLLRDWYRVEYDILLPAAPRDWDFWFRGENLFEDYIRPSMAKGESYKIASWKELQPGDILLFKLNASPVWNHCGVYIGNNMIMHHLEKQLSAKALLNNWKPYLCTIVRHKDVKHD